MDSAPVIEHVVETHATLLPRPSPSQLNLVALRPPRVSTRPDSLLGRATQTGRARGPPS
jgi:hypothetical protein